VKKKRRNTTILLLSVLLSLSLLTNGLLLYQNWHRNMVIAVPDGDSLDLTSGQRVRLLGLDAPERGKCAAESARNFLKSTVLHHHVTLKNTVTDDYGRTLANVFVSRFPEFEAHQFRESFLNLSLISHGFARYESVGSPYAVQLKNAQTTAKANKLGIWSEICHQTNPPNSNCTIKGNVRDGKKTYLLSGCKNYGQTIIDTSYGDQWFCTENEAQTAGFSKASGC
jgi:micrococcal nuclease